MESYTHCLLPEVVQQLQTAISKNWPIDNLQTKFVTDLAQFIRGTKNSDSFGF